MKLAKSSFETPSPCRPLRYKTQYCFATSFVLLCGLFIKKERCKVCPIKKNVLVMIINWV